jgi:hypothetical protein
LRRRDRFAFVELIDRTVLGTATMIFAAAVDIDRAVNW